MSKQLINLGQADKGNGDPLRTAFNKVNENFSELYSAIGDGVSYHLGDDIQFVDIDPASGIVVIQSGFDTGMPVYIKGANCSDEGVGGNVIIEAGGAPLPNNGTTGNIELAAQQTTIESNNNMWTFRDDGVLELPAGGDIVDSDGNTVLGSGGNANTGDLGFRDTTMYSLSGLDITNGDLEHGATAALTLPENGSGDVELGNLYGAVSITSGTSIESIRTWVFDTDGKLRTPEFWRVGNGNTSISNDGFANSSDLWLRAGDALFITTDLTVNGEASDSLWLFSNKVLQLPNGGDIVDSNGNSVLGGGTGGGLSITDFGRGFTDTLDSGKITTNKLYNRPSNLALNNHFELSVTDGGVVSLPDGSIINGATLKTVPGNYAGITAGPAGHDEDSWVYVDNDGAWIATKYSTDAFTWHFDNTGTLTLPNGGQLGDVYGGPLLSSAADKPVTIWTDNGINGWEFGADGILRIQTYGEIAVENDLGVRIGSFSTTVAPNSQIKIGGADHAFEIFGGPPGYSWQFDTNGILTFPGADGFRATFGSVEPVGDVLHSVNSLYLESEATVGLTSGADVAELENTYLIQEELFTNLRDQDEQLGSSRPWVGLPSYEAYDLIMAYNEGVGLPLPGSLAPAAYSAKIAYYNWQSARTNAGVLINVADNQWVFGVGGDLRVPGTISKTNILQLNSSGTGKAASVSIDGNNGRLLVRTSDDVTNKDWIFGLDGLLTLPVGGDIVDSTGTSVLGTTSVIDGGDATTWATP